ncbi:hypothetical protein FUSO4_03410 [Fusobacterium necrophorum DJ-1]|uniref:Uncharacterized protein n=3 Tax=Fusobacterium necrophorum TaxID=859 RepID=A0A0B4FNL4_9FUSO|nr:hypothetical protein FUSO3_08865 [Fusobacterium necrophorum BL]KDE62312.1 hypothetical protein FUSO5_10050 [Fusobacterium necrophorum BFTR-1]KDE67166.1 hypothetical protein FUSO4_03410 [Fusobacterium necrophorum DJ-1]KDE68023.1 hypothetical protein FUSO7_13670 [Fusobacterium necrophorum BFTR-2]KDE70658.1 hypothetical protein FUSO6_03430 [Fusobacterium necrophorum DAB]KDE72545.1 hypothetical protein FUSO8_04820 [Fusobacterium necrophorum DJ-2]KID48852.1 hypothetical protein C095_08930 [Fuso
MSVHFCCAETKYCDCRAFTAVAEILEKREEPL